MIPKIIHFVWVGTQPKPDLVNQCIASWKKYCPDYEIMEWGNEVLEQINNLYVHQAFENKKWAFVSDYIRLWALNKYGGFYFDSDLEITANIDKFRKNKFITGYESLHNYVFPFTAFMGASRGSVIIQKLLSEYDGLEFINPDGTLNMTTNTVRVSRFFENNYGLRAPYSGTEQTLLGKDGVIEPSWFFCTPVDGKENYSIHHFNGSWLDGWNRKVKIKIGNLSIERFRKVFKTNTIPLSNNEKILWKIKTAKKCFYAIVWRKK